MLKQRITTAIFMAVLFICSLFLFSTEGFVVYLTLMVIACAWEWSNLCGFNAKKLRFFYCLLSAIWMFAAAVYTHVFDSLAINEVLIKNVLLLSSTWWAIALLWVQGYPSSSVLWGRPWMRAVIGWLVFVPSWLALVYLYQTDQGPWLILLVVAVVIAADTGAYFFGRSFGKRKLAADVSPGKSWEGFFGGVLCCVLLSFLVAWYGDFKEWLTILIVIIPTALVSVLGDLFESMMKRHRGVKDSGSILPGHGGVLDRLDSLTAAAPVFTLTIVLTGWTL